MDAIKNPRVIAGVSGLALILTLAATISNTMVTVEIGNTDTGSGVWLATKLDNQGKDDGLEQYKCSDLGEQVAGFYTPKNAKDAKDAKDARDKCEAAVKAKCGTWRAFSLFAIFGLAAAVAGGFMSIKMLQLAGNFVAAFSAMIVFAVFAGLRNGKIKGDVDQAGSCGYDGNGDGAGDLDYPYGAAFALWIVVFILSTAAGGLTLGANADSA